MKIIVYLGTGGVGKTSVAAATALAQARARCHDADRPIFRGSGYATQELANRHRRVGSHCGRCRVLSVHAIDGPAIERSHGDGQCGRPGIPAPGEQAGACDQNDDPGNQRDAQPGR